MYAETRTNMIVPLAAMEPDGDSLRWEVTGADASSFRLLTPRTSPATARTGWSYTSSKQPDFENPSDRGRAAIDLNRDGDTTDTGEAAIIPGTGCTR